MTAIFCGLVFSFACAYAENADDFQVQSSLNDGVATIALTSSSEEGPINDAPGDPVDASSDKVDISKVARVFVGNASRSLATAPAVRVYAEEKLLTQGVDYEVGYAASSACGVVTISGIGEYEGSIEKQSWFAASLEEGTFFITSKLAGHRVLDITSGSKSAGAKLQLYSRNETEAQQFALETLEDGTYAIKNVNSGLYLCYSENPLNLKNGARVTQCALDATGYAFSWTFQESDDGYSISPASDASWALDVNGASDADGATIQLYACNGTEAQQFTFEKPQAQIVLELAAAHASDVVDGAYILRSNLDAWKTLDISGGSTNNGANAQLYDLNATGAQTWNFTHDINGFVTLENANSGKVLDVSGAGTASGTNVQQYASNGTFAQKWVAIAGSNGIVLVSALKPDLVLDISGGSASNGANAQVYASNDTAAQRWAFCEVNDIRAQLDAEAAQYAEAVGDGEYIVSLSVAQRKTLDVSGGSTSNGANVQSYESNMTKAQRWEISHDGQGYVVLTNVNSGKVLAAVGGSSLAANVAQSSPSNSYAQKWIAVPLDNSDEFVFKSALFPELVLDVASGSSSNGANVQLYASNGTQAQHVTFVSADVSVDRCDDLGLDGWCTISSALDTTKVLDVASGSSSNGTNLQLYAANDTFAQTWKLRYIDGYYVIRNAGSDKVLDVDSGNLVAHTNVQQWAYDANNDNQLFSLVQNSDGTYSFINKATSLVLDISGSAKNGANVEADVYTGEQSQCFVLNKKLSLLPEGYFKLASSLDNNTLLDVSGGSTAVGANVQLYSSNDSPAQKWKVVRVEGVDNTYTFESLVSGKLLAADSKGNVCMANEDGSDAQHWTADISAGFVVLKNVANGNVLDAAGGSTSNGTNIQTYKSNGSAAQKFKMTSTDAFEGGTYQVAVASNRGFVLDVSGGVRSNSANVQIYANNSSGAQKWNIYGNGDGTWTIQNCRSKKCLDVTNGSATAGANVQQWSGNGSAAQKWYIEYAGDGSFVIKSALNSNLVLDVSGGSVANGANVQIYSSNESAAQRFAFSPTSYTPEAVVLDVPCYNQYSAGLPNGCESAALTCVLRYFGFGLGDCTMADSWIPQSSWDFVYAFWGNPHSYTNGNEICAPGIANSANNYLIAQGSGLRACNVTGTSLYDLCGYLDDGYPVIIWTTVHQNYVNGIYAWQDGYFACANSHTVVLRGYDPNGDVVYLSDTIDGYTTWSRSYLASVYADRGYQAVVIK